METRDWDELVDEFDEEGHTCFDSEACVEELLAKAEAGCFYCRLDELDEDDD